MSKWTDCNEQLPPIEEEVLVWLKKSSCKQAPVSAGLFVDGDSHAPVWMGFENEEPFKSTWQVTHWMPLPEAPK